MKKFGLFILICALTECINSGEMKKFPVKDYSWLTQELFSQEETLELDHISVRYVPYYREGSQQGSITLNRERIQPGSIVTEFALNLFGLDKEYTVVNRGSFNHLSFPSSEDTIPFEIDLPYAAAVEFIGFKYGFMSTYDLA